MHIVLALVRSRTHCSMMSFNSCKMLSVRQVLSRSGFVEYHAHCRLFSPTDTPAAVARIISRRRGGGVAIVFIIAGVVIAAAVIGLEEEWLAEGAASTASCACSSCTAVDVGGVIGTEIRSDVAAVEVGMCSEQVRCIECAVLRHTNDAITSTSVGRISATERNTLCRLL